MREFLKGLFGEDKELIDTIMAEYGKHITEAKEQIMEYQDKIKEYETKAEENAKSLENLQNLTNENNDLKAEIQMNGSQVKKEFAKFVRSEVMSNVNDDTDFASALKTYKEANPQYFGETKVVKTQSSPVLAGGQQPQSTSDIMNSILRGSKEN